MSLVFSSQEKVLHLLIHNKDLLDEFSSSASRLVEQFDPKYSNLLKGLLYANTLSVLLTRDSYKDYVKKHLPGKMQSISEDSLFAQIADLVVADINDYPMLLEDIRVSFIKNKTSSLFETFNKSKDKDFVKSLKELAGQIDKVTSETVKGKFQAYNIKDYFKEWYDGLVEKRNNPVKRLLTGIKEIDESMQTGLIAGGLTLFVAEPGGMKTMMMMNIALNVFMDYGEPVCLVTLEMTREMIMNRIVARETGIDLKKITNPDPLILSDDEMDKIKKAEDKWAPKMHDFVILDNMDRMTMADIRRYIDKYHQVHKFRLLVIDYIAILQPEERYQRQNEYSWAGEMCKDIRQMGRKYSFHTISAVQLGKESLKKLKTQKPGKQSAGVEDMRGSHDYGADADNVYIQWPHPNEPTQKLCVVCGKARNGKKTFINDAVMAVLEIKPHMQLICTDNKAKFTSPNDPIHKMSATAPKIDNLDDLDDLANDVPKVKINKSKKTDYTDVAFALD